MEIRLDVDFAVLAEHRKPGNAAEKNNTLANFLWNEAYFAKYPPSVPGPSGQPTPGGVKEKSDRKTGGRVFNAMVRAINADAKSVELSEEQAEFLRDVLSDWAPPTGLSGYRVSFLESIEEDFEAVTERKKAEKAEARAEKNGDAETSDKPKKSKVQSL